jgi:hypothetical protein
MTNSVENNIQERLRNFQSALISENTATIVRKFLTFGDSPILDHDKYYNLKAEVAEHFSIHPSEVLIVGSAKMGFSIAPNKRFRIFHDSSDIDVAIISNNLFDIIWQQVFDYWNESGIWEGSDIFMSYLFRGWIRPDKLPPYKTFNIRKDWWEFFRKLTQRQSYGPYKVAAGLYKSWYFFESYQSICVKSCKKDIEL